ncbi:MAG: protein kinase [Treponema sp.]|jgi:serine/threonine protein kinase/tetratricopeptide (TPR) repeat protein|nr:protein kinase [Treponema sp.]
METQVIPESVNKNIKRDAEIDRAPVAVLAGGMLRPGEEVGGFRVDRLLSASGAEAEVYLCAKDNENYILKYYYTKKPNMEDKIKSLSHQNIISILADGEYKGRFFTILEYACGGALDDKMPSGAYKYLPVSDDDARQIIREILNAFQTCHNAGIIHRDIKPGNLFYKNIETLPDGRHKGNGILVGDFGIASAFDLDAGMSKHMTETSAKTEGYAAPEAYSGVIGNEFDYYSLGVTLWVLLTGLEPFIDEKGQAMYSGQITLDTIQGKTVDNLLSRSIKMSAFMQKLVRGLLTVRHDKRWKYDEVTRHLAGENVELFTEVRTLPLVEIGGDSCSSYQEIARAVISHPEEGKKFVFNDLVKYLYKIDEQKIADKLDNVIDSYHAENKEDEGAVFIAYSLCPNMAFPLEHGLSISSLQEMFTVLDTDPDAILPFLRDNRRGFYAYLEVSGLGEHGGKVKEIVNATAGDIRAVSRIITTFQGNVIKPFQDGVNNEYQLVSLQDLYNLPDYLKERVMIFIERNYGLLPAWIENLTGKNLDPWFLLLSEKKERIARWGIWEYFTLFINGLDSYDKIQKNGGFCLYEKDGRKVLFHITAGGAEILCGVEVGGNSVTLKKKDGAVAFGGMYAVNFADGYDSGGVSTLAFLDAEGRMAVFDGSQLYYFNVISSLKEPRHELKDGEIDMLVRLGASVPIIDLAVSLKGKNNFAGMNKLIEAFLKKLAEEKKYEVERNLLVLIDREKMEGLQNPFDFYLNETGLTNIGEGSYRGAMPYFQDALAVNSSGVGSNGQSYNYGLALAFYYTGGQDNWKSAVEYADKAMTVTPEEPLPLVYKAYCLEKLGKYNEAIACLTMALGFKTGALTNAEKASAYSSRANCYNALGMKDKADKDSAESKRLGKLPDAPSAFSSAKFCGDCGAKLEPGEKFCGSCGAKI